jgi:8-oxo-dGTP diphosphatase
MWALPGGFVDVGEKTEDACLRELHEETGIRGLIVDLLGVYSDPKRDPRAHCVSVTYACAAREENPSARASDDAAEARWFGMDNLPPLAFDHAEILQDARVWYADGGREALRGARLAEGR